jgi:hypothetical protein
VAQAISPEFNPSSIKKNVISSVLSGIQGDCKVTAERVAPSKDRYKMTDTDVKGFFLLLVNSSASEPWAV